MSAPIPGDLQQRHAEIVQWQKEKKPSAPLLCGIGRERSYIERIAALEAQLATYNTNGFADSDAMASAYLDMRHRAEIAEEALADIQEIADRDTSVSPEAIISEMVERSMAALAAPEEKA